MPGSSTAGGWQGIATALARWILGGMLLYMGWSKVMHASDFLVAVRQYQVIQTPLLLNLTAALLPWIEVFWGLCLLLGVAVRGTAVLSLGMLLFFNGLILQRALELQQAAGIAFCAVRFDCGCGAGEVWVCRKLVENGVLILMAAWVLISRRDRWCLRRELSPSSPLSPRCPST